jgi:hypothetical protein
MFMRNYVLFTIISLFILACNAKQENETSDSTEALAVDSKAQLIDVPLNDLYSDGKTKLIKTANYRFQVDNVKKSTEAIEAAIKKYPAYISSSNLHLENPILENKITIRVQSEFFNNLLKDIDQEARFVNFRNVTTADVEKEFVDLESRIKTKREVEARYIEILRSKTGNIEELLHAEKQIGDLHEEIEAAISRINYLKDQVRYSTINLEFYQTITQNLKAATGPTMKDKFLDGLTTGWNGVVGLALVITYLWPLLILAITVLIYFKARKRKFFHKAV